MWQFVEDDSSNYTMTQNEQYCEEFFDSTTYRDDTGRFVVRYPIKSASNLHQLQYSYNDSLKLFRYQYNRIKLDPNKNDSYKFMNEYLRLGHMKPVIEDVGTPNVCYIPHHAVYKESSSTTKIRIVFNDARKISYMPSLNECLHTGPKLENNLTALLLKWRLYKIGFVTDIEKCFRHIKVHPTDCELQRIFWADQYGHAKSFRLLTVTYGLNCSPYLTIKVLRTLANQEEEAFPLAANIVRESFYMDDF